MFDDLSEPEELEGSLDVEEEEEEDDLSEEDNYGYDDEDDLQEDDDDEQTQYVANVWPANELIQANHEI